MLVAKLDCVEVWMLVGAELDCVEVLTLVGVELAGAELEDWTLLLLDETLTLVGVTLLLDWNELDCDEVLALIDVELD